MKHPYRHNIFKKKSQFPTNATLPEVGWTISKQDLKF
jgi:hypothetical protein